jgi:ketosteroid isomerase-like protein
MVAAATSGAAATAQIDAPTVLRAADAGWAHVFSAKNLTASVAYVDPAGSVLAPQAPRATGHAAIRKLFAGFFALPDLQVVWQASDAYVARSGEIGYTTGTYRMSYRNKGKRLVDHGKYVTVWKHEPDGSWKVTLDIFNSDLPGA